MAQASKKSERVISADEKTIWGLFSVAQEYDQPPNNLVAWWSEKPNLETLFKTLNIQLGENDKSTVAVVKIWSGEEEEIDWSHTSYRLELIAEGKLDA